MLNNRFDFPVTVFSLRNENVSMNYFETLDSLAFIISVNAIPGNIHFVVTINKSLYLRNWASINTNDIFSTNDISTVWT